MQYCAYMILECSNANYIYVYLSRLLNVVVSHKILYELLISCTTHIMILYMHYVVLHFHTQTSTIISTIFKSCTHLISTGGFADRHIILIIIITISIISDAILGDPKSSFQKWYFPDWPVQLNFLLLLNVTSCSHLYVQWHT